jgi:8-oxo-dGTP pyrophosphatase MutT (NUDIX family)
MSKINLIKAIVRYIPLNFSRRFVYSNSDRKDSARYLLLQKAKDDFFPENIGKWEFVGGRIENGETSLETITREITEETGLKKEQFAIVKLLKTLESDKSICNVYLINTTSMDVKLSPEHSDYVWKKAEDIKKQNLVLYADLLLEFFNNPEVYLK